jgi:hypoxanthine phosphoribosyltransferase
VTGERETLAYELFGTASRELAEQVADDVADTGTTLELVRDFCAGYVAEVRTAVIYEKPQSVLRFDYVWRRTDRWIDFPWSTLPPVVRRSDRPGH